MEESILKSRESLENIYREKLLPVFNQRLEIHHNIILSIKEVQKVLQSKSFTASEKKDALKSFIAYKKDLNKYIENYFIPHKYTISNHPFQEYHAVLDQYLETLEETVTRVQDSARFYPDTTDTRTIKFKKYGKRTAFKLSKLPVRFINIFRRLFKKTEKPIHYWRQTIPLKNLTQFYFKSEFTRRLLPLVNEVYKEITEVTNMYWSIDYELDKKINSFLEGNESFDVSSLSIASLELKRQTTDKIEALSKKVDAIFNEVFSLYKEAIFKTDTVELSKNEFSPQKLSERQKQTELLLLKNEQGWDSTYEVLKDDWGLDNEIYSMVFTLLSDYYIAKKHIADRAVSITTHLETIAAYLNVIKSRILETDKGSELKAMIKDEIETIRKEFIPKIIVDSTTFISSQDLPVVLTNFESAIQEQLKNISQKRAISTDSDYLTPTKASDINYTSPSELINYESWPLFSKKINTAKIDMSVRINEVVETIEAFGQIIEFNLESALSLFDEKSIGDDPKTVAVDGIQRSLDKITTLKQSVLEWETTNHQILYPGIDDFIKNSIALTETENIYNIRLTIAKAKSVEKSKALKQKVVTTIKNFIPIALATLRSTWVKSKDTIQGFLLRTGIYKPATSISKDLSDFLKEEKEALEQLPFVYKRLFHSETFTNEDLFVGRTQDLATLNTALESWQRNRYATVIISGERGSGKTSLLHSFINTIPKATKTYLLAPKDTLYTTQEFFAFLNQSFGQQYHTFEEWVTYFNSGSKKVVVLENIQFLFVRKVNGFAVLHQISELLYATHASVLWILTCSKYSYQYLDKSLQISEHFPYRIDIDDIDNDTMTHALLQRHKKSGYDLLFEEPPKEYMTKKLLKSNDKDKQRMLREDFFKDLNKIARSNFKIAFTYWLRSTTTVSDNVITLRSLKRIDVSFLEKLASNKLFVLHAIVLQEKLKAEEIVSLSGFDKQKVSRIINSLYENGLLTLDGEGYYNINILLYRQITTLLRSKNFIY
ncbi:AAA family ATPase [Aquimarina sp. 2-A2]|uniref:AAA family ATPase n=1 Tax=Aquimarina sp. 2-A2 TaxID=3382644 RepID=UPI00387EF630